MKLIINQPECSKWILPPVSKRLTMDAKDLRYIVFLISSDVQQYLGNQKIDTHDGEIFCSFQDAREYAVKSIEDQYCSRFVIGMFRMDKDAEVMRISSIETYGFKNDRKNVSQLNLFP